MKNVTGVHKKDASLKIRVALSLLCSAVLSCLYAYWYFSSSKLEIDLEVPQDHVFFQVFYSDGNPMSEKDSRSESIDIGNKRLLFTFTEKIKKIRIDPATARDVQLKISRVEFSDGFKSREISFAGKGPKEISKKIRFHQLEYRGDGVFFTTGKDPCFQFNLEDIPEKQFFPVLPVISIIVLAFLVFFLPQIILFAKKEFNRFKFIISGIRTKTEPLIHDYPFLIYALFVILLGWGFELFNFTFTFDDEFYFALEAQNVPKTWMIQKRWGMATVSLFTGNPTVPVIPLAMTLFCYFLSFCILFYRPSRNDKYYIFPIYAVFPLLFQSFSFSSLNPGIGIGFLLSALSVRLLNKRTSVCFLLSVVFAAFAVSSYEIFAIYIALAAVYCWLCRGIRHDFYCRFKYIRYMACKYVLWAGSSFLLYLSVLYVYKRITGIQYGTYATSYIVPVTDLSLWYKCVSRKIWQYWSGGNLLFPSEMVFQFSAICICSLLTVFLIFRGKRRFHNKVLLVAGVIFLLFAPFIPFAFNQFAAAPVRVITILFPLGLTAIFQLALQISKPYRGLRKLIVVLLFAVSVQYLWNLNQNTYVNYVQNKRDIVTISKLQNRISSLPEFALRAGSDKAIPVLIIGANCQEQMIRGTVRTSQEKQFYPYWRSEMIGKSSLDVSPTRVVTMMNTFFYPCYTILICEHESPVAIMNRFFYPHCTAGPSKYIFEIKKMLPAIEKMPMWPLNGSIAFQGDFLVIKLSDHLPVHSKELGRKQSQRANVPINGWEELTATRTDGMRLLHEYKASALKDPKVKAVGNDSLIDLKNTGRDIVFPGRKIEVPYVILEITADFDKADTLSLWPKQDQRRIQFAFEAGENHLKLRCPACFLNTPFLIRFGTGKAEKVLLKDIKVFDDAQYTDNLIRLNPELNRQKLMEILHE